MTVRPSMVGSFLALLALNACSAPGTTISRPATPPPINVTEICRGVRGDQLVLYSTRGLEYWYDNVLTNFEQDCHVKVFYIGVSSELVLERLEAEKAAPLADLAIMQAPFMTAAADEGLLDGPIAEGCAVSSDRCDARRRWCAVVDDVTSWVYNPAVVSKPPATWDDILSPTLRGGVLAQAPDQSIFGFATQVLLSRTLGVDRSYAYTSSLEANVRQHYSTTDLQSRDLALIGGTLANGNLQEHENDVDQFHNLAVFFPGDGATRSTLSVPYGAGLVSGGHNQENARALLRYMWSREMQTLVGDAYGLPVRADVNTVDVRARRLKSDLAGIRILRVDWETILRDSRLGANWQRLRHSLSVVSPALPPPPALPAPSPSR